ncbi:hypothetical protein AC3HA14_0940 [Escherichia phage vB_EcoM_3HA14]|uniref:Uncharacterized protein n=1 Tax=Escherichia phage vB_EcoM_3HA14 TaxID=2653705 RepID=A0A7G3M3Y6_9CAUD|nr:hypothetical protein AC3HA14_0940 [Escherichia phage vB_EcoM_3HA14]
MLKLHIVVYKNFADIQEALSTRLDKCQQRLFLMFDMLDYKQPDKLVYKDGTVIFKSEESVTIFVKHDMPAKNIGMLEFYIYQSTGMRGESIKIDSIEVFEKPKTPLKKYLVRKL